MMQPGNKRQMFGTGPAAFKKRKVSTGPTIEKNALMRLNEIQPGIQYDLVHQAGLCKLIMAVCLPCILLLFLPYQVLFTSPDSP